MTVIDPSTDLGRVRLRCGDFSDLPFLPDSVYIQVLQDSDNNVPKAAKTCATYILGSLAFKTHRKMGLSLEVWGKEAFESYKDFLLLTVSNPAFMDISPIPYSSTADFSPIIQFASDWNKNFTRGTESQQLATNASISPNSGDLYGPTGGGTDGWQLT